ncbi:MAG: DUF1292 domain-containing protein [Lachnospiraceae bacterium]|nr:DUF1292 domain-containing protein [Lachnospiraceae bacterium]
MKNTTITFDLDDGSEALFEVLEETKINGVNYLLVVSAEENEDEALILREDKLDENEIVYIPVEDEQELQAISKVFLELVDDISFE